MINVAVINLKTLTKIIIRLFLFIIVMLFIINTIRKIDVSNINLSTLNGLNPIDDTIMLSYYFNKSQSRQESGLKKILVSELVIFSTEEELMEKENQEENIEFTDVEEKKKI